MTSVNFLCLEMQDTTMKAIFRILVILSGMVAVTQVYLFVLSFLTPSSLITAVLLFSGLINLVNRYAWRLIGNIWDKPQELEQKISETSSEAKPKTNKLTQDKNYARAFFIGL
jgi:cytoskeletal protein RodZ